MQRERKGKASAGELTPGFFHFAGFWMIVALAVIPGYSQDHRPLRSLTTNGNSMVPSAVIAAWLESRPGMPFVASDVQTIRAHYAARGFPFARIDSITFASSEDTLATDVAIWITEGKPARLSSVRLNGINAIDKPAAESAFGAEIGQTFVPSSLEHNIGTVLTMYERAGYPFARISVVDIVYRQEMDSLGADVLLNVDEGVLARISHFRVEGNSTTKTDVIVREAHIAEGEIFRSGMDEQVRRRLVKLQLFSTVSMPTLFVQGDSTVGMFVTVVEGNPNRFNGVAGYVPASGSSEGYVTGLVDVQLRNIFGSGRKFSARWFRETQSSQEINLQYREPWVAGLPVNADVGFSQRKQDSTYIRSSYRFGADLMATDEFDLGMTLSIDQVTPTEGFGRRVISQSRSLDVGAVVSYDSRNDPLTPTSGLKYRTEYSTGYKRIESAIVSGESSRSATQRILFDAQLVVSPFVRQVIVANLSGRDFRSVGVELSDLYRLGGAMTLRGYREGQFLGSRIAWTNFEYRLLAGQRSYAFGFVDAGYAFIPDRPEAGLVAQEITRYGYGAGLRADTPLGLIGVSLAFGKGDTFGTAKLHVQLANEF